MGKAISIYWANGVFKQSDRIWNRMCAEVLRNDYGYTITLPQDEANQFVNDQGIMDSKALAENCVKQARRHDVVIVVLDGADTDSGASFEAGARHVSGGIIIGVRTDFRHHEYIYGNAMFALLDTVVYLSSLECEDPAKLCAEINQAIKNHYHYKPQPNPPTN